MDSEGDVDLSVPSIEEGEVGEGVEVSLSDGDGVFVDDASSEMNLGSLPEELVEFRDDWELYTEIDDVGSDPSVLVVEGGSFCREERT